MKPKKCELFKYLGKIITEYGYHDDPANTDALDKINKHPSTIGELRSLLGFLGYYRSAIKDYARIVKPLYDIISDPKDNNQEQVRKVRGY